MPIRRAKSPSELYAEVADYDLAIVPDGALADAVDRRVEEPTFGPFATTPRRLAGGRRVRDESRRAFLAAVDRTDHPWQAVSYAVENVLQCWEHEGHPEAVLDYPAYVDETTRDVLAVLDDLDTTSSRLQAFDVDGGESVAVENPSVVADGDPSVAVVGEPQLTPLGRSVLPEDYDRVDLFTDEAFDHPPFEVFDSSADVVDALLDTVDAESAGDVAVVVESGSRYASLVEAGLEAAGVPHYGGPGFADDPDHRAFLSLLRTAHRGSETTVADVRPIRARAGVPVPVEHDAKRLDAVDVPGLDWIARVRAGADSLTFADAADAYEAATGRSLSAFREELATLGLADAVIERDRVEDLAHYLARYEVPVDRDDEGVLLADPASSGYVDRPAVFHVGLDDGWTREAPRRPWVDADARFERDVRAFQLLVQSGTERYFLVQDAAGGRPVTPCPYLRDLLEADFERFSDLDSRRHAIVREDGDAGFERDPLDVDAEPLETISQSALNTYVNSPRDYFFGRLLDEPDRDYRREGTLFHDFAEFYAAHPDFVDDDVLDEVVAVVLDSVAPFVHDDERPLRRRRYRIGVETIAGYLDDRPPDAPEVVVGSPGWGSNVFAEHFGRPVDSPVAERWFEDADLGVAGKIDLVRAADHLVDYKSGYRRSAYDVVRGAAVDPPADPPDFQAALYLAYLRDRRPDHRLEFTFLHFLEGLDDVVAGEADIADAATTVTYYPEAFESVLASREAYEILLDGHADCVETVEALGFPAYREVLTDLDVPPATGEGDLRESAFADEFAAAVGAATDGVDAAKGCDQAVREFDRLRRRAFFPADLDAVEAFVAETIDEIDRRRADAERFPVDGPGGEPDYRRVDHRDLLLEGRDGG